MENVWKQRIIFTIGILNATAAAADGGYYFATTELAVQTRQEALIALYGDVGEERATYVLTSDYDGAPEEFAWVIPLPGPLEGEVIAHEDDSLFRNLEYRTAPSFRILMNAPAFACACAAATGSDDTSLVEIVRAGRAGILDYVELAAIDATALLDWLHTNGFAVPTDSEGVLDRYVGSGGTFLALRVSDEVEDGHVSDDTGTIAVPPIQFTCVTDRRTYPMAISAISAAAESEVVVYTLAATQQQPLDQAVAVIDESELARNSSNPSGTTYEDLVRERIAAGGPGTMILEYAGNWAKVDATGSLWPEAPPELTESGLANLRLTRLRTLLARTEMTFDYAFTDAPGELDVDGEFEVALGAGGAATGPDGAGSSTGEGALHLLAWLVLPGLYGVGRVVRGRRSPAQGSKRIPRRAASGRGAIGSEPRERPRRARAEE